MYYELLNQLTFVANVWKDHPVIGIIRVCQLRKAEENPKEISPKAVT
jgi:hypothetical protein